MVQHVNVSAERCRSLNSDLLFCHFHRVYHDTDADLPSYPEDFKVAKYSIFEKVELQFMFLSNHSNAATLMTLINIPLKTNSDTWCVLELQSFKGEDGWQYRVVRYWKDNVQTAVRTTRSAFHGVRHSR